MSKILNSRGVLGVHDVLQRAQKTTLFQRTQQKPRFPPASVLNNTKGQKKKFSMMLSAPRIPAQDSPRNASCGPREGWRGSPLDPVARLGKAQDGPGSRSRRPTGWLARARGRVETAHYRSRPPLSSVSADHDIDARQ
ncbi:hypothetical protein BDY21DRAFT_24463 [Lineolata rhizophorae]|uniref:Uncharacterized protein n=1 Tax=Lineolata rhizophorae TaxID=578093 RepID=A0A6A6P060_9PEZI|nr:hypothetical protein BDY21DRAFT_24463 [Lineolata rhizophorae]